MSLRLLVLSWVPATGCTVPTPSLIPIQPRITGIGLPATNLYREEEGSGNQQIFHISFFACGSDNCSRNKQLDVEKPEGKRDQSKENGSAPCWQVLSRRLSGPSLTWHPVPQNAYKQTAKFYGEFGRQETILFSKAPEKKYFPGNDRPARTRPRKTVEAILNGS